MAFVREVIDNRNLYTTTTTFAIEAIDSDGSNEHDVVPATQTYAFVLPRWSADSQKLYFTVSDPAGTSQGVWVVNADGTGLQAFLKPPAFYADPSWAALNIGVPVLAVTPAALNFGSVVAHASKTLTLRIRNTGQAPLTGNVGVSKLGAPFKALAGVGGFSLASGGIVVVNVRFTPAIKGSFGGTIKLTSNDPLHRAVNVAVSGRGS